MNNSVEIKSALISVYNKDGLEPIVRRLYDQGVTLISTGGTWDFINGLGLMCIKVESMTGFPAIFGGRVKTLDPHVFGGILARRGNEDDLKEMREHNIHDIDLVIVDLYPFEETLKKTADEAEIIEKIDIGGISLIRAAAKNFNDVMVCASRDDYGELLELLQTEKCAISLADHKKFAAKAFATSSHYDTKIFNYFNRETEFPLLRISENNSRVLRYGENPHQKGWFEGKLEEMFEILSGKELSYNNLLDLDAAVRFIKPFWPSSKDCVFGILKHTNVCGFAMKKLTGLDEIYRLALAGDPVSAFGGIFVTNKNVDKRTAEAIGDHFFEIFIAPGYKSDALEILKKKKDRRILKLKNVNLIPSLEIRSALNGYLTQEGDAKFVTTEEIKIVTKYEPTESQIEDMLLADTVVKSLKSNAIALVANGVLIGMGSGQVSRIDALRQAIEKARTHFPEEFPTGNVVMASEAFFPFPDCVELAHENGINLVIQPGGSKQDQKSIDFCNSHNMSMILTGIRHFKH